jgi:hypothetical protein
LSHRPSLFRSWFGLLWSAAVTISASLQFPTGTTANLWDALGANRYLPISLPGIVKGLASLLRQTFGFVDDPLVYAGIAWGVMNRVRLSAVSARARRDYGSGVVGVIFKPQQFNPAVSLKSAFSREFLCPRDAGRWRLALEAARQALAGTDNPFIQTPWERQQGLSLVVNFYYPQSVQARGPLAPWEESRALRFIGDPSAGGRLPSADRIRFYRLAQPPGDVGRP